MDEALNADTTQITGVFGSERVPVHNSPAPAEGAEVGGVKLDTLVQINDEALQTNQRFKQAADQRQDEATFMDSTVLEGVGAAVMSWDTTRAIQRFMRPSFDNDRPINITEALDNIPMALNEDEREYVVGVGVGEESFKYAIQQVQDRRLAQRVVGDHEIAGIATSFIDPLWLAVPAAFRVGSLSGKAGRAASALVGAAVSGGVTAIGEGPVSDQEIMLSMTMGGAVSGAFFKAGKGVIKDIEYPDAKVSASVKAMKHGVDTNAVRAENATLKVDPENPTTSVVPENTTGTANTAIHDPSLPDTLQAGALNSDQAKLIDDVNSVLTNQSKARGLGETLQWNMRKTMENFGPVGKKVANLLYDNNSDLSVHSLESQREAIISGLRTYQVDFEQQLRQAMGEDGFGTWKQINPMTSRQTYDAQLNIERELQRELFRREQSARTGSDISPDSVSPRIAKMADTLDAMHAQALKELKDAGVIGAENLVERAGYLNRKWSSQGIDSMLDRMKNLGLTHEQGMKKIHQIVATGIRRGNGMDKDLANEISQAIITRALNKGYFEDTVFNAVSSEGTLNEIREIMKSGGSSPAHIDRVLKALSAQSDEAGKQGFIKHRMDIDYKASTNIGNEIFNIQDLIDGRVTSIVDQYNRRVATTSAFARMGLKDASSIDKLRSELSHDIKDTAARADAMRLFDNTLAHFRGEPAGSSLNDNFRLYQAYGRSISLAWSGLWQATEYATAMGEYGLLKTLKYAVQQNPAFGKLMNDPDSAKQLNNVLADHSVQSLRLRPYLSRYEDGFDMGKTSAMQLSAQTLGDVVPMANAMKYVHHHQAKMVGNLILDRLDMAAKGNVQARQALAKYGLEAPVMDRVAAQIEKHGYKVDDWDDAVWAETRPAFAKMMDTSVLKERLGDVPEFAKFDAVGKVLFTYRSFVLIAHNKVLSGGLERNGAGAVGLVLMYQFPLAMAAVQAQNIVMGKGVQDPTALATQATGQMGGIGLFSEPLKWVTGQSNSVGASVLIPADRGVKLFQSATNGDPKAAASTALTMLPVISAIPFIRGTAQQIKEN